MNSQTIRSAARLCATLVLLLATGLIGRPQSTNAVARPDYQSFKIITDRNIFDPNRSSRSSRRTEEAKPARVESFALVGTMSYENGTYAFFDGTGSSYRKAIKTGDTIAGQFREGDARGTFSLRRVDAKPPPFKQEEVSFRNGDVTLSGTLLLPLTEELHPAVVFLHGSGSEGRYAGRFLAEYFTRHGIAALIYDKRGVGKSTVPFLCLFHYCPVQLADNWWNLASRNEL